MMMSNLEEIAMEKTEPGVMGSRDQRQWTAVEVVKGELLEGDQHC